MTVKTNMGNITNGHYPKSGNALWTLPGVDPAGLKVVTFFEADGTEILKCYTGDGGAWDMDGRQLKPLRVTYEQEGGAYFFLTDPDSEALRVKHKVGAGDTIQWKFIVKSGYSVGYGFV